MKKLITILFFLITSLSYIFGQQAAEETYKEMFLDGEFFLNDEEYVDALSLYQKLYKRGFDKNANINYRMGICYLNIPGEKEKSIQHLEKAAEKADNSYKEGVFKQDKGSLYRAHDLISPVTDLACIFCGFGYSSHCFLLFFCFISFLLDKLPNPDYPSN